MSNEAVIINLIALVLIFAAVTVSALMLISTIPVATAILLETLGLLFAVIIVLPFIAIYKLFKIFTEPEIPLSYREQFLQDVADRMPKRSNDDLWDDY